MNKRAACKINGLSYPAADKITGRISTLNRSMACTLMIARWRKYLRICTKRIAIVKRDIGKVTAIGWGWIKRNGKRGTF